MGSLPFGILYGTLAAHVGFPGWMTLAFSIIVFGGSSQLVFINLFQTLGSPMQALLGSNIVNARHLIYSAGMSRKFEGFSLKWKLFLSYLLTDQLFAVSQAEKVDMGRVHLEYRPWFYFGAGICTWFFWIASTAVGIGFGHLVPRTWNLSFSVPLLFMPMIFAVSHSRAAYVAVLFASIFVFLLRDLPYGLGVFCSILLGSGCGYIFSRLFRRRSA